MYPLFQVFVGLAYLASGTLSLKNILIAYKQLILDPEVINLSSIDIVSFFRGLIDIAFISLHLQKKLNYLNIKDWLQKKYL